MKELLQIFLTFFKIGAFTFGGGYAMIPLIQREAVEKHHWVTDTDILDIVAIAESTPGPIAINAATFVGYRQAKVLGAIVATLGVIAPSYIIITIIATVLSHFAEYPAVIHAFAGIRVAVCALIVSSVIKLAKGSLKKYWHIALAVGAFMVVALFKLSPVYVVIACAVLSFIFGKKVRKA